LTILADTGGVYALLDRDDAWHEPIRDWWEENVEPVLLPVSVMPEVSYLAGRFLGARAELALARSLAAGEFTLEPLEADDLPRAADLMATYLDAELGWVDATVVSIAERLGITRLLTTDRRDFSLVRPRHVTAFELLP
jgi:hypothetical protein